MRLLGQGPTPRGWQVWLGVAFVFGLPLAMLGVFGPPGYFPAGIKHHDLVVPRDGVTLSEITNPIAALRRRDPTVLQVGWTASAGGARERFVVQDVGAWIADAPGPSRVAAPLPVARLRRPR